ncbi:hypothetical protein FPOA_07882 [Fusarium poae]|uniref:Uncharacterized protein n=1 Tax=Fusarium poae TaxID=36050 RepID=A0A1B8ALS6_FUSPO|nr:hypothetical protein FPOA_07882 [Fusarium poae]
MRYADWDVLLFQQNSATPLQEFKVACYVVHDTESLNPQALGVPTVTCFVPSLEPGTPFQISIHLWKKPQNDQVVDKEHSAINARLFIDGSLVTSTFANLDITWPCVVSRTDGKQVIGFPIFQQELLYQRHWSAADNLGRIKLVISEGNYHGSQDKMTFQKANNLVVFSFQHAPQDVLEHLEIAWPNPSMWRRLQQSSTPSQASSNSDIKDQIVQPYTFQGQAASECTFIRPGTPSFYLDDPSTCSNAPMNAAMPSWGHIVPLHNQNMTPHMSTPELRFRKEDFEQIAPWPGSPMFANAALSSLHQTQQQVLQQMYTPSNGSVPIPPVRLQTQSPAIHESIKFGRGTTAENPARLLFGPPAHNSQQRFYSETPKRPGKRARADTPKFENSLEEDYGHQKIGAQSN